ncbi:hypothetical protein SH139x_005323 [Planctomycetaceae bacterium SH139]
MDDCRQTKFRTEELDPGTTALTGPPQINIDFKTDAIGGSASNAWFAELRNE